MPPSPVYPPGTELADYESRYQVRTSHFMGLAGYSDSINEHAKLEFYRHAQMGSSFGVSTGTAQHEGSSWGVFADKVRQMSASTSTYKPRGLLTSEPNVPGLSEVKSLLISHDKTQHISIDEQGSCCKTSMESKANVHSSKQGLDLFAASMPNQAAASSDINPPGVSGEIQTSHPPFFSKQDAISSAVCLLTPTLPTIIEPHIHTASIQGYLALSSRGYELLSAVSAEENPPGIGETPSVAAVSSAKSSSTHLHFMAPFPQPCTGNAMPASPLIPPGGITSRFSTPSYGFNSQFPLPSSLPPPPPPPPPPLLPQRHIMLSGPPPQMPRFGLCERNVESDMTRKCIISNKEKLTIFVGKIVASLNNDFLTSVLELCGSIQSWTRAEDPVTGIPKGFGFCEYESPEGLLRALRLLNRLKLEGQELVLKVGQTTLNYLEHYVDEKIERLKSQMGVEVESAPGLEAANVVTQLTFDVPREVPVEERLGWVCDKENEIDKEVCEKLVKLLEERDRMKLLDLLPVETNTELDMVETDEENDQGSPTEESWRIKLTEWKQFEYALERCKLKGQGLDGTCRSSDSYYLEYEKLWEERERAKENQQNMERERVEAQRKRRQNLIKKQEESNRSHKRMRYDAKYKKILSEEEKDNNDGILERLKSGCTTASSWGNKEVNLLPTGELSQNRFLDLSTRAKIAFCFKSSSKQRPSPIPIVGGDSSWGGDEHLRENHKQQRLVVSSVNYRNPTFRWERESTPENRPSMPEKDKTPDANELSGICSERRPVIPEKEKSIDVKEIIDSLPRTKSEIFAFCMDWAKFDEHCLHERIRPWVSKKISEFLGEEEATLVDFIVSSAKKHMTPTHLLELLENIFVEEAEIFVVKLWRIVIYEIRKVECGFTGG